MASSFVISTSIHAPSFLSNSFPAKTSVFTSLHFRQPSVRCSVRRRPDYVPNQISDPKYVRIFDTTLREGEQSAGASMTAKEKLDIARSLAQLGVDIIEAGFPASSEADFKAVKMIAQEVGNADSDHVPVICAMSRCSKKDIEQAWEAVKDAKRPRLHTFIATSEIHMKYKLRMTQEQVIERVRSMVAFARSLGCDDLEFSTEDGGRSDKDFLYRIFEEAIAGGATTINVADTVGYNLPNEFGQLVADIKANTRGIENVVLSVHCQNDLGLSTANALAGAEGGARQLEVTINGIGERAGNTSLEEVVMAMKCRGEMLGGLYTGINTQHIVMASKMVEEYSGLRIQPHKAIVGANAFAHESGIHQDGVLKNRATYEIISPDDIGLLRLNTSGIVLGKLSGRHALRAKMLELGFDIDGKELDDLFVRFKALAGDKKSVSDDDLVGLVADEVLQPQHVWKFQDLQVTCGTLGLSTATVKLTSADGIEHVACCVGKGPVDAAYKAVDHIVQVPVTLIDYQMNGVSQGIEAIATTNVMIRSEDGTKETRALFGEPVIRKFSGTGAAMDIVISSVQAYINAINKMLGIQNLHRNGRTANCAEGAACKLNQIHQGHIDGW